jgi:hypothetical protein
MSSTEWRPTRGIQRGTSPDGRQKRRVPRGVKPGGIHQGVGMGGSHMGCYPGCITEGVPQGGYRRGGRLYGPQLGGLQVGFLRVFHRGSTTRIPQGGSVKGSHQGRHPWMATSVGLKQVVLQVGPHGVSPSGDTKGSPTGVVFHVGQPRRGHKGSPMGVPQSGPHEGVHPTEVPRGVSPSGNILADPACRTTFWGRP